MVFNVYLTYVCCRGVQRNREKISRSKLQRADLLLTPSKWQVFPSVRSTEVVTPPGEYQFGIIALPLIFDVRAALLCSINEPFSILYEMQLGSSSEALDLIKLLWIHRLQIVGILYLG